MIFKVISQIVLQQVLQIGALREHMQRFSAIDHCSTVKLPVLVFISFPCYGWPAHVRQGSNFSSKF